MKAAAWPLSTSHRYIARYTSDYSTKFFLKLRAFLTSRWNKTEIITAKVAPEERPRS